MTRPFWLIPVAMALLTANCGIFDPDSRLDQLEANRDRWRAAALQHYRMDFRASCYCLDEFTERVTVEVSEDSVVSVVVVRTGLPVGHVSIDAWPTVLELFDAVEEAIIEHAHELEVTYHAQLGYPEFVFIDRNEMTVDEEMEYRVFALEAVQ